MINEKGKTGGAFLQPRVSVITVCLNSTKEIEKTILSIINQDYNNLEYIIVDGGSSDGTLNIIHSYEKYIDLWVSEPDEGIYDAMNKGIKISTGDWLLFMNAGDCFNNNFIVSGVVKEFNYSLGDEALTSAITCGLVYGNAIITNEELGINYRMRKENLNIRDFYFNFRQPVCHQAVFFGKALFKQIGPYDKNLRLLGIMNGS